MPPVLHTPPPPPSGTDALRTSEDDIAPQVSGMLGLTLLMGHFFLKPTLRKLPFIVLIVCIAGAIPAPPIALFLGWLLDIRWDHVFKDPQMLIAFACLGGACYA